MRLVGWGTLSASGYPIVLQGSLLLPQILPHDDHLHAILRAGHTEFAYLFSAVILLHVAAALLTVRYFNGRRRRGMKAPMAAPPNAIAAAINMAQLILSASDALRIDSAWALSAP